MDNFNMQGEMSSQKKMKKVFIYSFYPTIFKYGLKQKNNWFDNLNLSYWYDFYIFNPTNQYIASETKTTDHFISVTLS